MLNLNNVLDTAIKQDASDVHLLFGLKPVIRVARELKTIEEITSNSSIVLAYPSTSFI